MENNNSKSDSLSYKELIYFKEEIFHSLKDFQKKVMEKTNAQLNQFNAKLDETKSLISKNKNELTQFITKEEFQEEKKDILNKEKNQKIIDEKLTSIEIQISAIRKEINEACYKYDKIFIEQLTLPGIIGDKCKYKSIKDYIKNNINEMSNVATMNQKALSDIRTMKGKLENRINEFHYQIEGIKQQLNHSINLKLAELENKINDRIILVEDNVKKIIFGEPIEIKESNNDLNNKNKNNEKSIINIPRYEDINKIKKELNEKMKETNEKSKKMDLTVLREFDVIKSEFNYVKKTLYELAKVLMMELEDGEGFKRNKKEIINDFLNKNKILELNNYINTTPHNSKRSIEPKRGFSSLNFAESKEHKNALFHRMKTGVYYVKKKNSVRLNNKIDTPRDNIKEDDFLDYDFFKKNNFMRNSVKKKTMLNNNDFKNISMGIISEKNNIDDNNNNNSVKEKNNFVKPIFKPSSFIFNSDDKKKKIEEQIINENKPSINDSNDKINLNNNQNLNLNEKENEINKKSININNYKKTAINQLQIENNNNTNYNTNNTSSSINTNTNINIKPEKININKSSLNNNNNNNQIQKSQNLNNSVFLKIKSKNIKNNEITNRSLPTYHSQNISSFRNRNKNKIINSHKIIPTDPTNFESVPDSEIIDIPLIPSNKNYLEIDKNKSTIENRIIELEFFTKKKFDELVSEIKNFIPIHFNSYIRDYKIIQSPDKKKKIRQISLEKQQY